MHRSKFQAISPDQISVKLGDWINGRGKYHAFTVAIRSYGKGLELRTGCLKSEWP